MYQNIRRLYTKMHEIISNFNLLKYDVFGFTKTWLTPDIQNA